MIQLIFRVVLIAAFAVWFGGFTFYTSVVVPIGTDVLGSSRTQGFVTQQVTDLLNWIGGFALALMVVDFFWNRLRRGKRRSLWFGITVGLLFLFWILLLVVHPMLDAMLEPEHEHVNDSAKFYQMHRIYLWGSTIQWLVCWVWLVLFVQDSPPKPTEMKPSDKQ